MLKKNKGLGFVCLACCLQACGLFWFSGAALPPEVKTFSVQPFYARVSEVSAGPLNLAEQLTEGLAQKVARMTLLAQVEDDGHVQYEGAVTAFGYRTVLRTGSSESDEGQEVQRLTVTVEVSYYNKLDEENSFKKKSFSAHKDLLPEDRASNNETHLVEAIVREIAKKIYSESIDNW